MDPGTRSRPTPIIQAAWIDPSVPGYGPRCMSHLFPSRFTLKLIRVQRAPGSLALAPKVRPHSANVDRLSTSILTRCGVLLYRLCSFLSLDVLCSCPKSIFSSLYVVAWLRLSVGDTPMQ